MMEEINKSESGSVDWRILRESFIIGDSEQKGEV